MRVLQMIVRGSDTPVVLRTQGETAITHTRDGMHVTVLERTPSGRLKSHSVTNVQRVAFVDPDRLCPKCGVNVKPDDLDTCYKCLNQAAMLDPIEVREERGQFRATYHLTYPQSLSMEKIKTAWENLYHPMGYDTEVRLVSVDDKNDTQYVVVQRRNSAD